MIDMNKNIKKTKSNLDERLRLAGRYVLDGKGSIAMAIVTYAKPNSDEFKIFFEYLQRLVHPFFS